MENQTPEIIINIEHTKEWKCNDEMHLQIRYQYE